VSPKKGIGVTMKDISIGIFTVIGLEVSLSVIIITYG